MSSSTMRRVSLLSVGITFIMFVCQVGMMVGQDRPQPVVDASPAHDHAAEAVATATSENANGSLLIGQGDLLQVSLYGVPEFNEHVRVDSNGEISLPMIGAVKVVGLSTERVERIIERKLKEEGYYKNPQITVLQQEFGSQTISVLGEVTKPGVYPVLTPRKLFDMLSAAGGMTPKAGRDILITRRTQPNLVQRVSLASETEKQMQANVDVFPGDTIVVTKAPIVYVVGDVRMPGGFVVDKSNGLTILQALALAQGATSTAKLDSSKLIHKTTEGPKETAISLKKILEGKAPDLKLDADDILFVPHSASKGAVQGMTAVLATVAGAAVYRF
jgi:polysaccharide biosynthesis/export protein